MDYRYFYEHHVGIKKIKYTGDQGLGRCPLPNHADRNPSFSFNNKSGLCKCFGCGFEGNPYLLAKELKFKNFKQFIEPLGKHSNNSNSPEYKTISRATIDSVQSIEVLNKEEIESLKKRYKSNIIKRDGNIAISKHDYFGLDDNERMVFFYPNAIKHHKSKDGKPPYWEGQKDKDGKVIGSHCQIYLEHKLDEYDKSKPLIIYEGELDALISTIQGISFSHGCSSIPDNISKILEFETIIIIYDNDEPGRKGARKLAERIKAESPTKKVKIANWNESLPDGYDVSDDFANHFEEFDKAIVNATEFNSHPPIKEGYTIMNATQYVTTFTKPPEFIIEHILIDGGVTLLSGTDGVGKTWINLQMAFAIANGEDFLGFKVNQRKVLLVQYELSSEQLSSRLKQYDLIKTGENLNIAILKSDDMVFSDSWSKIEKTIDDIGLKNGVVMVDNIYTSTSSDVSNNHELKSLLFMVDKLKRNTGNAFCLVGHHNKQDGEREPLLTKNLITGGKTLTNYVSNVIQIGNSSMGADVRRMKITKTRDSYTDIENMPIRLEWNPEECLFIKKGVISNEVLHTFPLKKQWEFKVLIEMADTIEENYFDRKRLMTFITPLFPEDNPDTNYKRGTRWLTKMTSFGLIIGSGNRYELNHEEIKYLEKEVNQEK